VEKDICNERHERINARLEGHDDDIREVKGRVGTLEKSDAVNSTEIKNLCKQIGSQTQAIWGLVAGIFFVLLGFVVWYIQSLPR
jgi:tetrahydromethanopterin S-methyltransferase subunit G